MKLLAPLTLTALLLAAADASAADKYTLKSGVVTFERTTLLGKVKMTEKEVVYFDDHGSREASEKYDGDRLVETTLCDGKTMYTLKHDKKTAYTMTEGCRGTELRVAWSEISEDDKRTGKAKQGAPMTVAGKTCEVIERTSGGTSSSFAGFQGLTLFSEVKTKAMTVTTRATKLEENAAVPADKLKVPAGYTVKPSGL